MLHENIARSFRGMASLSSCVRILQTYATSSNAPSMAHGTWICRPGKSLLIQMQLLRESKPLMKCSLTFPCNSPCRDETFWRRRNQLHGVSDRSSAGCRKHIRSALWSTIVILIRSRIVKQRAHKDVRESEHTQGCVLRAVAGTTSTVVDLIRSTSCEHCRPLCLRHPEGRPSGEAMQLNCRLERRLLCYQKIFPS